MPDNNKVSIDIKINADGQNQINQYKGAFDSLRSSITNLSTPISSLDKNISTLANSISNLNNQNTSVSNTIVNVGNAFANGESIFKSFGATIAFLRTGVISLEGALTGGLSVIIAFLPQIIEITKRFLIGNDAISTMAQNFKNLNEVMKAASKDAAEQTTKLDVLYKSANNTNNAYADRLKYAQQLKDTYPEQFKNFDREQIANGKAKGAYNDLAKSILASAKAKAALNKMTEQTAKLLDADYQIMFRKHNCKRAA